MSVSIDRFLNSISASGILSAAETEQLASGIPADQRAENADELARDLVRQGKLTRYQAAAIYQEKADGLVLGNYLLLDKLGAGGMGQVFRARHRRMDRVVALKVLPQKALADPTALARFQREAKAAARLAHPNIVTAHDADEAGAQHFLVMEYIEGSDLAGLVKSQGPLAPAQALDYVLQAARGLEHAHAEGIVHRDIKPSNLLLDKKGTIKILDMGLALISDPLAAPGAAPGADLTQSGSIMGSIDYMAPEQAMDCRQADARSDIYSLGCTLHYLLTGRPPYGGDTVLKRLTAHQQAAIPMLSSSRADIPPGVQEVFSRMMAKRPAARFQTAGELVAALETLRNQPASARPIPVAGQPLAAQPAMALPATPAASDLHGLKSMKSPEPEHRSRTVKKPRSKAPLVAAAVVLLLAAGGAGAWAVLGHQPAEIPLPESANSAAVEQPVTRSQLPEPPEPKPATAEPPPEPAPAASLAADTPQKSTPADIAPPAKVASDAEPSAAAPAMPAAVPKKPQETSPPAVSPPVTLASAPLPAQQPAADGKLPIPDTEGRAAALKLVKELYKDDYEAAKEPEAKAALAEKLLNQAQETKDDAAAQYTLLQEARDLAVDAGSPTLAERAIAALASRFPIDSAKEMAAGLDQMAGKPHPADANRKIAEAALARVDETLAADDFETAKQLADAGLTAARKSRDSALVKRAVEVGKTVNAAKQQWEAWKKAEAALAQSPDDPAANLAVGRHLAFVQGDWEQGLAYLAKGPDGTLKELAAKGLKPPTEPAALAEMGDAWFAAADKAKGKDKADLRSGAAYWYTQAEPGLTGLVKTIVEKRLKELGGKVTVAPSATGRMPETIELALAPAVGMKFRLIPAGTFTMGTPGVNGKQLPHQVNITRPFYFGITEVTQAQWLAVTGSNPSADQGNPSFPVQRVSWDACQEFLARLNRLPANKNYTFRLPTEAEWEYACRAGTTTTYSFGDDVALLPDFGWFAGNAMGSLQPVAQLKPNPWGLFDIHGGVWEWCSDWYAADYYKQSPVDDPQGPASGTLRTLRGGSYWNQANAARSAERGAPSPENGAPNYGLRVVCEPKAAGGIPEHPGPAASGNRVRGPSRRGVASIDLLKLINLQRDVVFGTDWKLEAGRLIVPPIASKAPTIRLMVPVSPPPEYALHVAVTPAKNCGLLIGLVVGGVQCGLYCDPGFTGLGMLDGLLPGNNETSSKPIWDGEKPVDLLCEVRPGAVVVKANGQLVFSWIGDPQRLSLNGGWVVPNKQAFILGPRGGPCEITRLELGPIGMDAPAKGR